MSKFYWSCTVHRKKKRRKKKAAIKSVEMGVIMIGGEIHKLDIVINSTFNNNILQKQVHSNTLHTI